MFDGGRYKDSQEGSDNQKRSRQDGIGSPLDGVLNIWPGSIVSCKTMMEGGQRTVPFLRLRIVEKPCSLGFFAHDSRCLMLEKLWERWLRVKVGCRVVSVLGFVLG